MPEDDPDRGPSAVRSGIRRADAVTEFETEERCAILEVANDADDGAVSIARARVRPGVTTAWHHLIDTHERYLIVSGRGRAEIGERPPADVAAGDVVRIPAGVAQRIENIGDTDLVFYAICSPRFTPACYVALE